MIIYRHEENLTDIQLNDLGSDNWELVSVVRNFPDQATKHFYLKKGFSDIPNATTREYSLIENVETGAEFYINKSFSYGDAIIITFITIFFLAFLGKIIFNYLFYNE